MEEILRSGAPSFVLHRNLAAGLPVVVKGEGVYLFDADGRRYIDASGGAAVSCLGHSHAGVKAAIKDQLDKVAFAHSSFFTNEPAEALADFLVSRAPTSFGAGRVAFLGSGSEAVEAALKLARQYHVEQGDVSRTRFVSRRMSYHGNTLGSLAVGGHSGRRAIYQPILIDTTQVAPCYSYREQRADEDLQAYGQRAANDLEATLEALGPTTVAAFILEPVAGATLGSVPPAPGYLRRVREICDRHGVLLIADEVMCGMGRCGALFVCSDEGVAPDLITVAKGLGAGYQPIAAVLANEKVVNVIRDGSGQLANGHTYMSHPIACAGALAAVTAIEELLPHVRDMGAALESRLTERFGPHPNVGDIRGRGLFWSLELVRDRTSRSPFPAEFNLAARIKAEAQASGLICYPSSGAADGRDGDHILLAPPFIIQPGQLDEIVDLLARVLDSTLARNP